MMDVLFDAIDGNRLRRDFDALGLKQDLTGELCDFLRHRRGEQQGLTLFRKGRDDFPYIGDESHVEHAIGFVENQIFGLP